MNGCTYVFELFSFTFLQEAESGLKCIGITSGSVAGHGDSGVREMDSEPARVVLWEPRVGGHWKQCPWGPSNDHPMLRMVFTSEQSGLRRANGIQEHFHSR